MIKISDYKLIEFDHDHNSFQKNKKTKKSLHFKYLYPKANNQPEEWNFQNERKQKFIVKFLQSYQQCQEIHDLIQQNIFEPSQQIYLLIHKNPQSQRTYISINTLPKCFTLTKVISDYFKSQIYIPSQIFCTFFIEKILQFCIVLEKFGLTLKIITPDIIYLNEDNIYLDYTVIVELMTQNELLLKHLQKYEDYCAPELLKILRNLKQRNISLKNVNSQLSPKENSDQTDLNIYYDLQHSQKQYSKAVLYSSALCILECFRFKVSLQDRYVALKNPKELNCYIKQLRKQIKTFHQGKFISKLLKLMLELRQSLRDSIDTFKIKMNSAQFNFLKKNQLKPLINTGYTLKTESQIHDLGVSITGKKTIDIIISTNSNNSSINRSWLSTSHVNCEKTPSPIELVKGVMEDKNINTISKNKQSLTMSEINEIKQQGEQNLQSQNSVVDIQMDWDDDSVYRQSEKSKRFKKIQEEKDKLKVSINTIQQESLNEELNEDLELFNGKQMNNLNNMNNLKFFSTNQLSKTQNFRNNNQINQKSTSKINIFGTFDFKNKKKTQFEANKTYSINLPIQFNQLAEKQQIEQGDQKKYNITKDQIISQKNSQNQNQSDQMQFRKFKNNQQFISSRFMNRSIEVNTNSFMSLQKKQSEQLMLQPINVDNIDNIDPKYELPSESNLSIVMGENEFAQNLTQNKSFYKQNKQSKQIHKYLLKKDKYKSRSRIIILTLLIAFLIYKFIDWFININGKNKH